MTSQSARFSFIPTYIAQKNQTRRPSFTNQPTLSKLSTHSQYSSPSHTCLLHQSADCWGKRHWSLHTDSCQSFSHLSRCLTVVQWQCHSVADCRTLSAADRHTVASTAHHTNVAVSAEHKPPCHWRHPTICHNTPCQLVIWAVVSVREGVVSHGSSVIGGSWQNDFLTTYQHVTVPQKVGQW